MAEEIVFHFTAEVLRKRLQGTCIDFHLLGDRLIEDGGERRGAACSCRWNTVKRYGLLATRRQVTCRARGKCMLSLYCICYPEAVPYFRPTGWLCADVCGECGNTVFGWGGRR